MNLNFRKEVWIEDIEFGIKRIVVVIGIIFMIVLNCKSCRLRRENVWSWIILIFKGLMREEFILKGYWEEIIRGKVNEEKGLRDVKKRIF